MNIFKWLFKKKKYKVKLGLALGSGGAKGFAELGALKAFEENGIEFDYIAGTSIGSIIGAFYANGYTSTDILEMLKRVDISEIKSFFMIKMDTSGLFNVIDRSIGSLNIEELKKPFMAVATNSEDNSEKDFSEGSVAKALCASASYPPFFKPVLIDGNKYIDGAFTNSVPADLVKKMGADLIVGIDLATHETAKPNILSMLLPSYESKIKEPWQKGYDNSDFMLHPDLSEYKAVSFAQGDKMYEIGYKCAMEKMTEIKNAIEHFTAPKKSKKKKSKV